MKKLLTLLIFCTGLTCAFSQGFEIQFTNDLVGDSIVLKTFNSKSETFELKYQFPLSNNMVLQGEEFLEPSIYVVGVDSLLLFEVMISEKKRQKFDISFLKGEVSFTKSKENMANQELLQLRKQYEAELANIDKRFAQLQQSTLPKDSLQPIIDSIIRSAELVMDQQDSVSNAFVKLYDGMLLSSVIASSKEVARPPKEIYANRAAYLNYFCSHLYDDFAWHDARLLRTAIPSNKHRVFVQSTFQIPTDTAVVITQKAVKESMVNEDMFYFFLDYLTKHVGSFTSRYHDELLYIAVLKEALTYPNLNIARKGQYEYQLSILDKNHAGDMAPNFTMKMSTNDTIELYDIEAEYMILYFQNPDCPTCAELLATMETMNTLQNAVHEGRIKVVTVFFEEDESYWQRYLKEKASPKYLHGWNYDLSIDKNKLYNTHYIPMMMFLDKDKKIIKKDLLSNEIERWLKHVGL